MSSFRLVWLIVVSMALLLHGCETVDPAPADAEFMAFFDARREAFAELAADPDHAPLPESPWGEVRRSVSRERLEVAAWHHDIMGPGGCEKGFVYPDRPPAQTVASLDEYDCPGNVTAYRSLSGGWYLYYRAND